MPACSAGSETRSVMRSVLSSCTLRLSTCSPAALRTTMALNAPSSFSLKRNEISVGGLPLLSAAGLLATRCACAKAALTAPMTIITDAARLVELLALLDITDDCHRGGQCGLRACASG